MIQQVPRCFRTRPAGCTDPVYAPPLCDHPEHASAVFHGICLMEWREHRTALLQVLHEQFGNVEKHGHLGHLFREGE